jgi:hypothetical protein
MKNEKSFTFTKSFIFTVMDFIKEDLSNIGNPGRHVYSDLMRYILRGNPSGTYQMQIEDVDDDKWSEVLKFQAQWQTFMDWFYSRLSIGYGGSFTHRSERSCSIGWCSGENAQFYFHSETSTILDDEGNMPPGAAAFFESLHGYPTRCFLVCPTCSSKFLNPSEKRKMVYCCKQCQVNAGVRRTRQKKRGCNAI